MAIKSNRYVEIISKEQEEKSLADLYLRLAELQQQVDDLKKQADGIGDDISGINEQTAALQNEINLIKEHILALGSKIAVFETDLDGISLDLSDTRTETAALSKAVRELDCSAFEVYAHDTSIPVGELTAPHLNYIGQPGDIINRAVPASMTHQFIIRSEVQQSEQNTVVDWGDGAVTKLVNIVPQVLDNGAEYRFTAEHTYAKNGTYIVKIIGRDYFSFIYGGDETKNLLCRIFDVDLPIAPWIWNVSGVCRQAQRLLRVNFYSHPVGVQAINWSSAFLGSRNLLTVYGFTGYNNHYTVATQIFTNARGLIDTDFTLCPYPRTLTANSGCFIKCGKLAVDINKIIPVNGFKSGSSIDLTQVLWGCSNITGTVPADLLWNDTTITWVNTEQAFADCSAEIRAQVPVSWGGTA